MWLIQRGFVRCEARWEIENKKRTDFSHMWNCFETEKVAQVFIVVGEMGREKQENTYIFTQKGLRSKSYCIRDFVLAFFPSFFVSPLNPCRAQNTQQTRNVTRTRKSILKWCKIDCFIIVYCYAFFPPRRVYCNCSNIWLEFNVSVLWRGLFW